jgi:hypothetical protein
MIAFEGFACIKCLSHTICTCFIYSDDSVKSLFLWIFNRYFYWKKITMVYKTTHLTQFLGCAKLPLSALASCAFVGKCQKLCYV